MDHFFRKGGRLSKEVEHVSAHTSWLVSLEDVLQVSVQRVEYRLSLHLIAVVAQHNEEDVSLARRHLNFLAVEDALADIPDIVGLVGRL